MLGRAVLFRCVAAVGHGMRIHAFRGGGGGCARSPVRRRLLRAAEAPGTAHVTTTNTLAAYGHNVHQYLRDLVVRSWSTEAEEEVEEEEGGCGTRPPP